MCVTQGVTVTIEYVYSLKVEVPGRKGGREEVEEEEREAEEKGD